MIQLQGLLASRFAQLALVRESALGAAAYQNPDDLARSLFKEMTKAGLQQGRSSAQRRS